MLSVCLRLVLVTAVICLDCWPCRADESALSLESVLAKWEAASKACRTIDATMTVLRYDAFHTDRPKTCNGRFYFEAPNLARYEIHPSPRTGKVLDGSDTYVWTAEGLFLVNHHDRTCQFWSSQAMTTAREAMDQMPEGTWLERFSKGYALFFAWPAQFARPDDLLPLFLNTNTQTQRQRYDIRAEERDGRIVILAVPKQRNRIFREVQVMLEKDSYRLVAHQLISTSGDRTVHVFDDLKLNKSPSDRDMLIRPVPVGYRVIQADGESKRS